MSQHAPNWNLEDNTRNYGHILPVETEENPLERAGDLANLLWQDGQYAAIQEQEPAAQECEQLLESIAVNLIQQQGSETASWFENFPLEKVFCADFFPDMAGGGAGSGEAIPDMINANVGVAESGGAANAGSPPANPRDGDAVNEFRSDQIQKHADGSGGDDGGGVAGRRKEGGALWSAPLVSEPKHVPEATFAASGGGEQLGECSRGQKRKQIDLNGGEGKDAMEALDAKRSANRIRAAEVHNLTERRRRDRINEKMKALQGLIPNSNKTDKASLLDEAIEYLKALQLQVQIMWMRRTGMAQMMFPGVQLLQYDASGMGIGPAHLYQHHNHHHQHQHQHHGVQIMHQNGGGTSSLASSSSPGNLFFNAPAAMNAVDLQSLQMERAPYFAFPHLPPPHPQMSNLCAFGSQILHQSQLAAVATSITLPTVDCDQDAHGTKPVMLLFRPRPGRCQTRGK